jgi:hypothetical protein
MNKPLRTPHTAGDAETPFARFTRNMRALMAVPKKELDAKIEQARRVRQRQRRAATAKR